MDEDNWKFAALVAIACIIGALLMVVYHAVQRAFP